MCDLRVFLLLFLQAHNFFCDVALIHRNGSEDHYSDVASIRILPMENFTIQFLSEEFQLDSVLTIADRQTVIIRGKPSHLTCNHIGTGIHIYNVIGLVLNGITLVSCSNIFNDSSYQLKLAIRFISSIYILDCTDVTIEQVGVTNGNGSGLVMFDNNGTVLIHDCTFSGNTDNFDISLSHNITRGGSGLHIVISYCGPRTLNGDCTTRVRKTKSSEYAIGNCSFSNNSAGSHHVKREDPKLIAEGFSRGGGLSIAIDTNSSDNTIQVMDCSFAGNTALWGGGLYLVLVGNAYNNMIHISNCVFSNNNCATGNDYAGGGAVVGYQEDQHTHPYDNTVKFSTCCFESNRAGIGGGFIFYSGAPADSPNQMIFWQSRWTRNLANLGAGIYIGPLFWRSYVHDRKTKIVLSNCNFTSNRLINNITTMESNKSYRRGAGILFSFGYHIVLEGTVIFHGNGATAMYLTYTDVEFSSNVNAAFSENKGFQGGAICMLGFAALIVNDNTTIKFEKNSATTAGGAIFQNPNNKRDNFASRSCFIRYKGTTTEISERNINISFKGNVAFNNRIGSIFLTTLLPCLNSHTNAFGTINSSSIQWIGNFSFEDKKDVVQISTYGNKVMMDETTVLAVPGKNIHLPMKTLDDLCHEVFSHYRVMIKNYYSNITLGSLYMSNKSITFYGKHGDEADVVLETIYSSKIVYKFHVKMLQCPPGFFLEGNKCVCPSKTLPSIQSCNNKTFEATLSHNYWIGYENNKIDSDNLIYGLCPFTNCLKYRGNTLYLRTLPQDASTIENETCNENYRGILCSKCKEGYALQYNDHHYYSCRTRDSCRGGRGWLLYIAMEIVPVTIFFVVVMVFNIQFTDGAVNGVIFFIQISDTMFIKANGIIRFQSTADTGLVVYRFFSRIFNLNFFSVDQNERFSFCLWESASTLDLLAVKYITILYASSLVAVIIALFKYCHSKILNRIFARMKRRSAVSTKSTIIHGISGFLVICYSECARISFHLITPAGLFSQRNNTLVKRVAFHNGELPYFRGRHLFYTFPACVIILALGVLPPLILISYPLCYRVLAFLKIGETRFSYVLCTFIPLEKFKPFFDSFQSSFKDEFRFFSGLYFLYRFITLATFAFSARTDDYFVIVQVQFAVIFAVHAICQPYKKRWHNILDSLLFLNLSLVNIITYFNFQHTINSMSSDQHHINTASTLQVVLLYLPLAYLTIYAITKTIGTAKITKAGSKVLSSLASRMKTKSLNEPSNYHRLENRMSLSIAEERRQD